MRIALLFLFALSAFLIGCDNKYKDPDPQLMGYTYYPLEVGDYRVYDVTDTRYLNNQASTSQFQLRERVDTSFLDQTGQLVYKIIRSVRQNGQSPWLDDSVITVVKTETMVLRTQNNTKVVKLVFPVKEGKNWAGDAFNTGIANGVDPNESLPNRKEEYKYGPVGEPYDLEGQTYPKTVTVTQGFPVDDVQLDDRKEVYAEGIGLIYRLFNKAVYCEGSSNSTCEEGVNWKETGHERHEVLIEHGKL